MTKKPPPQASKAKQLRRQFGGAFGRAPGELQHFLARDLPIEARTKTAERVKIRAEQATEQLASLINGDDEIKSSTDG